MNIFTPGSRVLPTIRSASAADWPDQQLPLVALLVNELNLDPKNAHFWGMDEWFQLDANGVGRETPSEHPLSFERADRELCFDLIRPELQLREEKSAFPESRCQRLRKFLR